MASGAARSLGRRATALLLVPWLVASGCAGRLDAPAPTTPTVEAAPPVPPSVLETFVRIPLSAIEEQANAAVPRTFEVAPYTMVLEGSADDPTVTAGYRFERGRLDLTAEGSRLLLRTTLAYWVRARRHVGPIEVPVSCGVDEPLRHVDLAVSVDAAIAGDFALVPTIGLRTLSPTDRCEMSFAGVDVTGQVREAMRRQLESELPALRDRIRNAVDLRGKVADAFSRMSAPIELEPGRYLLLQPESMGVSRPTIEGHFVRIGLSVRARPVVHVGARPVPTARPMPTREDATGSPRIELHVPVEVSREALEAALREEFHLDDGGVRIPATGRRFVRPTQVDVSAYGTRLVVRVAFTGYADGVLYLEGTPTLDPATQVLSSPDLEFTLESRSLLVRLASFLRAEDFRDELRRNVRLELRESLEQTRMRLTEALRQDLSGISLEGAIDAMELAEVRTSPTTSGLVATLRATGRVTATYVGP